MRVDTANRVDLANSNKPSWEHQKIVVEHSVLWPSAYGDYYRLGQTSSSAPLVVYFGGAISVETYDLRRETEPIAILIEFQSAVTHLR